MLRTTLTPSVFRWLARYQRHGNTAGACAVQCCWIQRNPAFYIDHWTKQQNDPLGQDAYGYYIFDWGDTTYPQCPNYSWIGIAPAEGGNGTALTLSDPGSSFGRGDQNSSSSITTVNLPFAFKF